MGRTKNHKGNSKKVKSYAAKAAASKSYSFTHRMKIREKGKFIISHRLSAQINEMHRKVRDGLEWSGILIYKRVNPEDELSDLIGIGMFPMDVGNSTFTEYLMTKTPQAAEMYPEIEEDINYKIGQIHTHHSMGAFFSGTDEEDLKDSADVYKAAGFASLIVNYKCRY